MSLIHIHTMFVTVLLSSPGLALHLKFVGPHKMGPHKMSKKSTICMNNIEFGSDFGPHNCTQMKLLGSILQKKKSPEPQTPLTATLDQGQSKLNLAKIVANNLDCKTFIGPM